MAKTRYAVLGLGRFGTAIARTLAQMGHHVLGVDRRASAVEALGAEIADAVQADVTDRAALEALHLERYQVAFVTISDLAASILCTLTLRELGVRRIIAKITSAQQGRILGRLGAEDVLFPERDMGERVARQIASAAAITMHLDLAPDASLLEMALPPGLAGRSLENAALRRRFGVTVVAVRRRSSENGLVEKAVVAPPPDLVFGEHDLILVAGMNDNLQRFQQGREVDDAG
jgi:trk system potassium uptake protein